MYYEQISAVIAYLFSVSQFAGSHWAITKWNSYAGLRAQTAGAPQNHWWLKIKILLDLFFYVSWEDCQCSAANYRFGPSGDPRVAGIGTPKAIKVVWSCHREIIYDVGPVSSHWEIPLSTWWCTLISREEKKRFYINKLHFIEANRSSVHYLILFVGFIQREQLYLIRFLSE